MNANYTAQQRRRFLDGLPPPDFPGGKGESEHVGRATSDYLAERADSRGLAAMGLSKLVKADWETAPGATAMVERANKILGFA